MSGLDNMRQRLILRGGDFDSRLNKGKLDSMHTAMWNSYQGEWITFKNKRHRCLINPEKVTTDYDQKVISIDFECGMKPGDTFYWNRTKHWWIAFNAHFEEEAYFRSEIRRCDYQIETDNSKYWIYVRGPVETALIWNQKHKIEFNDLNYSIEFFITKNADTVDFFSRHRVVKFEGHNWKVAATDKYSQDGLIEVYLEESFDNTMEDNMVIPEIVLPQDKSEPYIEGPQFVKPYDENIVYSIENTTSGTFVVNSSKVKIIDMDDSSCVVNIITGKSGKFDLIYRVDGEDDVVLTVNIESF